MRSIYLLLATLACAVALPAAAPVDPVLPVAREALPEPGRNHLGGSGKREAEALPEPGRNHLGGSGKREAEALPEPGRNHLGGSGQ